MRLVYPALGARLPSPMNPKSKPASGVGLLRPCVTMNHSESPHLPAGEGGHESRRINFAAWQSPVIQTGDLDGKRG